VIAILARYKQHQQLVLFSKSNTVCVTLRVLLISPLLPANIW